MSADSPVEMDDPERDEFLGNGGTGVISCRRRQTTRHTVPVSYGYDATETTFYFRLATGADGSKGKSTTVPSRS